MTCALSRLGSGCGATLSKEICPLTPGKASCTPMRLLGSVPAKSQAQIQAAHAAPASTSLPRLVCPPLIFPYSVLPSVFEQAQNRRNPHWVSCFSQGIKFGSSICRRLYLLHGSAHLSICPPPPLPEMGLRAAGAETALFYSLHNFEAQH